MNEGDIKLLEELEGPKRYDSITALATVLGEHPKVVNKRVARLVEAGYIKVEEGNGNSPIPN